MINDGRTLYEVQHILGHLDAKVTQRYAHLSMDTLHHASNSASVAMKAASRGAPYGVEVGNWIGRGRSGLYVGRLVAFQL
jgi:hypothetical protein